MKKTVSDPSAKHKATTNLPGRKQLFKVPGPTVGSPGPTFTGKEVRQAVYDSHKESLANQSKTKKEVRNSPLKPFGNYDHRVPKPNRPYDTKPIIHMKGKGHEYPLGDPVRKGPARVITQQTQNGHTKTMGVISHDMKRQPGDPGYNDHFQLRAIGPRKPRNDNYNINGFDRMTGDSSPPQADRSSPKTSGPMVPYWLFKGA